jgi:hypothetical protein
MATISGFFRQFTKLFQTLKKRYWLKPLEKLFINELEGL